MQRVHLFEFEDLRWFPGIFRRSITDLLTYQIANLGIYDATVGKLQEVLDKTGHDTIVDLCSGSGGPLPALREKLSRELQREIHLVLTDKYPNLEAFKAAQTRCITGVEESVDATQVGQKFQGFRTLFTAFHHFTPQQAKQILQDAVDAQMPIGVFEITERKPASLMTLLVAPITCLIFSLFLRPFRFSRFFWTYIIPVIPLLYTWDGLVSNLRSYTKEEWLDMTKDLKNNNFSWMTGQVISRFHIKVSYLIGYVKEKGEK
jgi:hypothetical protein